MSGANSQPWEFIVVKDSKTRERIFGVFSEMDWAAAWYLEQQRIRRYRHPAFDFAPDEKDKARAMIGGWASAPVYVMVLEDPRKQWGSVIAARGDYTTTHVLSASMGHLSMPIQLAAASLGLGSQRVDVSMQHAYQQILQYPEPLRLNIIVPIGYRAYEPEPPHRLPLEELVHFDKYDISKYVRDEDFAEYMDKIRRLGRPGYRAAISGADD